MKKEELYALGLVLDKMQESGTYGEEIEDAIEILEKYYDEHR